MLHFGHIQLDGNLALLGAHVAFRIRRYRQIFDEYFATHSRLCVNDALKIVGNSLATCIIVAQNTHRFKLVRTIGRQFVRLDDHNAGDDRI